MPTHSLDCLSQGISALALISSSTQHVMAEQCAEVCGCEFYLPCQTGSSLERSTVTTQDARPAPGKNRASLLSWEIPEYSIRDLGRLGRARASGSSSGQQVGRSQPQKALRLIVSLKLLSAAFVHPINRQGVSQGRELGKESSIQSPTPPQEQAFPSLQDPSPPPHPSDSALPPLPSYIQIPPAHPEACGGTSGSSCKEQS